MARFVDPKVDSAFKLLFGTPHNTDLIKDFLNATWTDQELARYRKEEEDLGKEDRIKEGAYKEGEQKGQHKKAIEAACNFLKMGLSIEKVAEGTGLSVDQVKALLRNLK